MKIFNASISAPRQKLSMQKLFPTRCGGVIGKLLSSNKLSKTPCMFLLGLAQRRLDLYQGLRGAQRQRLGPQAAWRASGTPRVR